VILFRPEAARELAADVGYYDEKYPSRGQRFAGAVERTLALIMEFPLAFPVLEIAGFSGRAITTYSNVPTGKIVCS
jgi:hypothetical protein